MSRPLRLNIVPRTLWNKSLAHFLPNWNEVRDKVCSCGCCAFCDAQTQPNKLHAHEVWKYNDETHMVDLRDIVPVCENCHMVLHFGKANVDGKKKEALAWYCKVNGVPKDIAKHEILGAFEWWRIRSEYPWRFNPGLSVRVEQITGISCAGSTIGNVVYLNVPFSEKDEAKALGARWDMNRKMWCIMKDKLRERPGVFNRWMIPDCDVSVLLNGDEMESVQGIKPIKEHEAEQTLLSEIMRGI